MDPTPPQANDDGRPRRGIRRGERRTWYVAPEAAERFDAAIDELHWRTRRPKHELIGAALAVAVEHQADIEARVTSPRKDDTP
jgi:hypothetical protein